MFLKLLDSSLEWLGDFSSTRSVSISIKFIKALSIQRIDVLDLEHASLDAAEKFRSQDFIFIFIKVSESFEDTQISGHSFHLILFTFCKVDFF